MVQQAGGLLGGAEAVGPQQDVLQFEKGTDGVHPSAMQAAWTWLSGIS